MIHGGRRHCLHGLLLTASLVTGLLFHPVYSLASPPESRQSGSVSIEQEQLTQQFPAAAHLATHPEWLSLLHFEVTPSGVVRHSYVISDSFFLSRKGRSNPAAELFATLSAFTANDENTDTNPLCRFPGRRLWLEANAGYTFKNVVCDAFDKWAQLDTVRSINMVFATGHFASPASFFGHNFLKITRDNGASYLLDTAINFGAVIPPNENPLTYLATGIFGGYEATYSAEPFYRFLAKYGEEDLRDVWEYELAFNAEQRNLLVAHLWELRDVRFPYYFFRQNCAYHISALLNIFTSQTFVPRYLPWAMPITVFDSMMSAEINNKPLVSNIDLHRSRRTLFQNRFKQSSKEIKRLIHLHSLGKLDLKDDKAIASLDESDKVWLVDTLLDYSAFMSKEKGGDVHKENQRLLLLKRLSLKQSALKQPLADKSNPPHVGQRPGYSALGITTRTNGDNAGFLRIRPAYYDFLGIDAGRKPHASFTLFDTQLKLGSDVTVRQFDIFSLSNLNTQYSGIAIDKASSWQLRLGNAPVSDKCNDCNAWGLQWDIGKSRKLGQHLAAFALGGISVNESRNRTANGALHAHLGVTGKIHSLWRMHAALSYVESFNNHQPFQYSVEFENRFGNSRWWDVRFNLRRRDVTESTLSMALYW